jgi:hypothetical protein
VRAELAAILMAWAETIGVGSNERCTLTRAIEISREHPELGEALRAFCRGRSVDAASLGLRLRDRKGTIVGKYRFESSPHAKGKSEWWVQEM